ncbi:DUF2975 domain-containing protein [Gracilimonas sp.]|uniref:DUF2975 domain-containing protein n=1 Tax=Gracilimonas sp. TaxID=1974203 RepID=UPI0028710D06|nr:DUF2975 domain-containing protein [Gracilimonas sp.]
MDWIKNKLPALLSGVTIVAFVCIAIYLFGLLIMAAGITDFGLSLASSTDFSTVVLLISFSKAFLLIILYLFWDILRRMKQGLPFQSIVIKRFYILGLLVFILPFINWASMVVFIFSDINFLQNVLLISTIDSTINKFASFLIMGIMLAAFAHVLKEGFSIYEEQKLTV